MMGSVGLGFNRMGSEKGPKLDAETVKQRVRAAAERARAEADARRTAAAAHAKPSPKELNGRGGLDPVRHGDWEVKGVASDF